MRSAKAFSKLGTVHSDQPYSAPKCKATYTYIIIRRAEIRHHFTPFMLGFLTVTDLA